MFRFRRLADRWGAGSRTWRMVAAFRRQARTYVFGRSHCHERYHPKSSKADNGRRCRDVELTGWMREIPSPVFWVQLGLTQFIHDFCLTPAANSVTARAVMQFTHFVLTGLDPRDGFSIVVFYKDHSPRLSVLQKPSARYPILNTPHFITS